MSDEERRLRPLELRLLAYMAEHPETVLSQADLLREVWGYAEGVETRTLYATINRLRLALECDPQSPTHILTVPRLGYRFRLLPAPISPASPLPTAWNSFIGRDAELAQLSERLGSSRLVTLRGPAGVGKSRLARVYASQRAPQQPVVWCNLAHARTADDSVRIIGEALGLGTTATGANARVAAALAAQPDALLILDDVDPVLHALPSLLAAWLAVPGPRVLVTSRSSLRMPGEVQLTLAPFDEQESRLLLAARVHERQPDFELPAAPWVASLLAALGGLPLTIELAAPWLLVMSGEELAEHVHGNLISLHEPAAASSRHHSLGDSLRWSWPLLQPWERATLLQCTAFKGAFDLRAARAVVRLDATAPPLHEVFFGLVERSWLRVDARPYGQFFSFYTGQHAFLAQQLPEGLRRESEARHTAFHAGLSRDCDIEQLYIVGGPEWQRLAARASELREALRHADPAARVQITLVLGRILLAVGPLEECVTVVEQALLDAPATSAKLILLHYRAVALRNLGQVDAARSGLLDALTEPAAPPLERGRLLRAIGVLELYHGDPVAGRQHFEAALHALRAAGATLDEAVVLAELGTQTFLAGDLPEAARLLEQGLGPLRRVGSSWVYAVYLVNLGVVELISGQIDSADRHLTEALELHHRNGTLRYEALALGNLALIAERRGDWASAHQHLDAAFALTRRTGDTAEAGVLWSNRGLVYLSAGQIPAAAAALEQAAALADSLSIPRLQAEVLTRRARVHIALGEAAPAHRLLDRAEAITTAHAFRVEADDVRRARAALSERLHT